VTFRAKCPVDDWAGGLLLALLCGPVRLLGLLPRRERPRPIRQPGHWMRDLGLALVR
jgi:hypothetical protein